jgi:N-ethylmaleimide reductase
MSKLFTEHAIGGIPLKHRVVMAPLTRMRSDAGDLPNQLMARYYGQRASDGGLIVSEASFITPGGNGYLGAPGIYADEQIAGWKRITDAVHAKGGKIFLQLWHVGRQSHSEFQSGGGQPVAPSATPFEGVVFTSAGWVPTTPARALEVAEIAELVEAYRSATRRAVAAGFDGVEVHAANGYLLDQFLHDGSNLRTDAYGGSLENRIRFLLEAVEAAASVIGHDRVAVRLGPSGSFGGMKDSDPAALFSYVARQLDKLNLAYLHLIEPRVMGNDIDASQDQNPVASQLVRRHYQGTILAAGGFTPASAEAIVAAGDADLVAFGRDFIANPDLPERIRKSLPFNAYNRDTFYGGSEAGYTDYPFYAA